MSATGKIGIMVRNGMVVVLAGVSLVVALYLAGCDSSSSGGGGSSKIVGVVDTFSGASASFKASQPDLLGGLSDLFVPRALAAVQGVVVTVEGTDISATTAEDGSFTLNGVPDGDQQLSFAMEGPKAFLDVNVPPESTVTLNDVDVSNEDVSVGSVEVEANEGADDNANDNDVIDDNANDNVVVDDNANDNVVVDDNANDNV